MTARDIRRGHYHPNGRTGRLRLSARRAAGATRAAHTAGAAIAAVALGAVEAHTASHATGNADPTVIEGRW